MASPLIRADVTEAEIRQLRVLAAQLGWTVPELVGKMIREGLDGAIAAIRSELRKRTDEAAAVSEEGVTDESA